MSLKLTIGWLYPDLMSTYGDRGNIIVLEKRCAWRGIEVDVKPIDFSMSFDDLKNIDLYFGGGSQDWQQGILLQDLQKKGPTVKKMIDKGTPGLFVCGSPQLLGNYYQNIDGTRWEGLHILDLYTVHFGRKKPRCIGNTIIQLTADCFSDIPIRTVVGFENHGGRTYLGKSVQPFGRVIKGYGNNGEDGTEGAVYKNCIATYSHGPLLTKNPHIADFIIKNALEYKYNKDIQLSPLDDTLEWKAHEYCINRFS